MDPVSSVYIIIQFLTGLNSLLVIVGWGLYLLLIGLIVKYTYAKNHPTKVPTMVSAAIGTAIGAGFNSALGLNHKIFGVWGLIFGVMGTIAFLWGYNRFKNERQPLDTPKS